MDENIVMIDGKMVDLESMEVVENEENSISNEKNHDVVLQYNADSDNVTIQVIRDDGKSWSWDIQSGELSSALNIINDYEDIKGGAADLVGKLDVLADSSNTLLNEVQSMVDAPNDFYTFTADVATQIVFFLSLIFGLLVFIVFSSGLKR